MMSVVFVKNEKTVQVWLTCRYVIAISQKVIPGGRNLFLNFWFWIVCKEINKTVYKMASNQSFWKITLKSSPYLSIMYVMNLTCSPVNLNPDFSLWAAKSSSASFCKMRIISVSGLLSPKVWNSIKKPIMKILKKI